jgi:hypothetical protein
MMYSFTISAKATLVLAQVIIYIGKAEFQWKTYVL